MLTINFFKHYTITCNKQDITHEFSAMDRALLCYLLANGKTKFQRDHLRLLLWGNIDKKSASNNLRYCIWHTRKILKKYGSDLQIHSRENYFLELEKNSFYNDFEIFQELKNEYPFSEDERIQKLEKISALYEGDFLEDFFLRDNVEFNDWLFSVKEESQLFYFHSQMELGKSYAESQSMEKALEIFMNLLKMDDLNEEIYYNIMLFQYQSKNMVSAIHTYRKLKTILREELNITPGPKVQQLYQQIIQVQEHYSLPTVNSFTTGAPHSSESIRSYGQNTLKILYYIEKQAIKDIYETLQILVDTNHDFLIQLCKDSVARVPYEGLFELADQIHHQISYSEATARELDKITTMLHTGSDIDFMLFSAFESFLRNHIDQDITFLIWNIHKLDSKTIELLSFLWDRKMPYNIRIVGSCHIASAKDYLYPLGG